MVKSNSPLIRASVNISDVSQLNSTLKTDAGAMRLYPYLKYKFRSTLFHSNVTLERSAIYRLLLVERKLGGHLAFKGVQPVGG